MEEAGKEMTMMFDADKCTGCRICELTCSISYQSEYNPKKSFIRIMANEEAEVYVPILDIQCTFCGKCADACPVAALEPVDLAKGIGSMKGGTMGIFPLPVYSIAGL
jgi:Fe-S-cluster-containing dehydrogenase component